MRPYLIFAAVLLSTPAIWVLSRAAEEAKSLGQMAIIASLLLIVVIAKLPLLLGTTTVAVAVAYFAPGSSVVKFTLGTLCFVTIAGGFLGMGYLEAQERIRVEALTQQDWPKIKSYLSSEAKIRNAGLAVEKAVVIHITAVDKKLDVTEYVVMFTQKPNVFAIVQVTRPQGELKIRLQCISTVVPPKVSKVGVRCP